MHVNGWIITKTANSARIDACPPASQAARAFTSTWSGHLQQLQKVLALLVLVGAVLGQVPVVLALGIGGQVVVALVGRKFQGS